MVRVAGPSVSLRGHAARIPRRLHSPRRLEVVGSPGDHRRPHGRERRELILASYSPFGRWRVPGRAGPSSSSRTRKMFIQACSRRPGASSLAPLASTVAVRYSHVTRFPERPVTLRDCLGDRRLIPEAIVLFAGAARSSVTGHRGPRRPEVIGALLVPRVEHRPSSAATVHVTKLDGPTDDMSDNYFCRAAGVVDVVQTDPLGRNRSCLRRPTF